MISRKTALPLILFSLVSALVLGTSCDDSAASSDEEELEQIEAVETGSGTDRKVLYAKWDGVIPSTWTRSERCYSQDKEDGYQADIIIKTWQQNWQGKWLYLARNFKDEDGELLCGEEDEGQNVDIIFFFDNKDSCSDGYYIYLNTLPVETKDGD